MKKSNIFIIWREKMKKTLHNIEVCKLLNGHELSLTLHEFTNNKPGPTLGLSGTIHGDEYLSIEIFRQFSLELENLNFKGRVLMLPVANPNAFGFGTHTDPIDMINLNLSFPGSGEGTPTEKLAHAIVTEYVPQIDYFIDFHQGGAVDNHTCEYTIIDPNTNSEELGKMLGQKYIYRGTIDPKSIAGYLAKTQKNKPLATGEFGGSGQNNKYYIQQGLTGIKNVMKYLKMIDGEPNLPEKQYCLKEYIEICSKNSGILNRNLSLESINSVIGKGELLGTVYNPYTFEEIERFYGPFNQNAIILLKVDASRVEAGEALFGIGNMDTAEQI